MIFLENRPPRSSGNEIRLAMAEDATGLLGRLINGRVLDRAPVLAESFAGASPFRYVVIDDFLAADFCREICDGFPEFDEAHAVNENGEVGAKSVREKVRSLGPAFQRMDDLVKSPAFLGLISRITGIEELRYDPWYFGGGTHESRQGQDLDPHIDFNRHPITRQHRRLNLIIYLNEEWRDEWGGSLQLHRDPHAEPDADEIVTVTPVMNRCVIFETTEHSWHGFTRIRLPEGMVGQSRKSFAIYLYTHARPAEETADEHSTVYVERHLPDRFLAGHLLTSEDVADLKGLLVRRDRHIERLYRQVQEVTRQLNSSWLYSVEMRLRRRVYAIENATSLPITAPLRALRRALSGRRGTGNRHDD